jgi:hypothetical protein
MFRSNPGRRRFSVASSPLNPVKLDLGLIVFVAALLWLVLARVGVSPTLQILALAGYGCAGMVWLLARTRAVVRHVQAWNQERIHGDGQEGL